MKRADYIAIRTFLNKELEVLEKDMERLNLRVGTVKKILEHLEKENSCVLHIKSSKLEKSDNIKEDVKKKLNEKYGIAYINETESFASITPDVAATDDPEKGTINVKTNDKKLDGKTIDYFTIDDLL